jgi:glycerate kinase
VFTALQFIAIAESKKGFSAHLNKLCAGRNLDHRPIAIRLAPMPLHVLIIPDKFKGTLTAREAAEAMARGWRRARPEDVLELLPMSDGGDGFGELLGPILGAKVQKVTAVDAAHRPCVAEWWWEPKTKTAIFESAQVVGLAMLPPGQFHPFNLDSYGLGLVVRALAAKGARRCLMGIGGSATNDGGFGLARALGWKFLDRDQNLIEHWTGLDKLKSVAAPRRRRCFRELLVAVDVQNLLLGPDGASRVYGPQKGLRPQDIPQAERCLRRLAQVVKTNSGRDFAREPGAGAAGGLGFGLPAFAAAKLQPGFELFARNAALERRLPRASLVITGEGSLDESTLMGKGVGQLARWCRRLNIPCFGLAGAVSAAARNKGLFNSTHALTDLTTAERAKAKPAYWLERLGRLCGTELLNNRGRESGCPLPLPPNRTGRSLASGSPVSGFPLGIEAIGLGRCAS